MVAVAEDPRDPISVRKVALLIGEILQLSNRVLPVSYATRVQVSPRMHLDVHATDARRRLFLDYSVSPPPSTPPKVDSPPVPPSAPSTASTATAVDFSRTRHRKNLAFAQTPSMIRSSADNVNLNHRGFSSGCRLTIRAFGIYSSRRACLIRKILRNGRSRFWSNCSKDRC